MHGNRNETPTGRTLTTGLSEYTTHETSHMEMHPVSRSHKITRHNNAEAAAVDV